MHYPSLAAILLTTSLSHYYSLLQRHYRYRVYSFYCHREGIGEAYDTDISFASALEIFGGGHDDPTSVAFGGVYFLFCSQLSFCSLSPSYFEAQGKFIFIGQCA